MQKGTLAMSLLELFILLLIAGVCGAIGQAIVGTSRGFVVSIALGFLGALIGTWLARTLGLPELFALRIDETSFPILWSILGATLLLGVVVLVAGRPLGTRYS